MARLIDITGKTFGNLTVKQRDISYTGNQAKWLCQCKCGNTTSVLGNNLRRGVTISCGCVVAKAIGIRNKTHGMSKTVEYATWRRILARCNNPNHHVYHAYGARGITVCDRWAKSFEAFFSDMGLRPDAHPTDGRYSIDREDNDGPYSPDNCRWATEKEQHRNTSRNTHITFRGETKLLVEWAEQTGILAGTIGDRISAGWNIEDALTIDPADYHSSAPI